MSNRLTVIVAKVEDLYVADCLEYDISVEGRTVQELRQAFEYNFTYQARVGLRSGENPINALDKIKYDNIPEIFNKLVEKKEADILFLDGCKGFGIPSIAEFYYI